jgi:hypothetical protein
MSQIKFIELFLFQNLYKLVNTSITYIHTVIRINSFKIIFATSIYFETLTVSEQTVVRFSPLCNGGLTVIRNRQWPFVPASRKTLSSTSYLSWLVTCFWGDLPHFSTKFYVLPPIVLVKKKQSRINKFNTTCS